VQVDNALLREVNVTQELNAHWWCQLSLRQTQDQRFPRKTCWQRTTGGHAHAQGSENKVFVGVIVRANLSMRLRELHRAPHRSQPFYFLDLTPRREYFPKQTSKDAAQHLVSASGLQLEGNMPAQEPRAYLQTKKPISNLSGVLVDDAEAWLRPSDKGIEVQTSFQKGSELQWRGHDGLLSLRVRGRLAQPSCDGAHYDPKAMQSKTFTNVSDNPDFYESAQKMVAALRASRTLYCPLTTFTSGRGWIRR